MQKNQNFFFFFPIQEHWKYWAFTEDQKSPCSPSYNSSSSIYTLHNLIKLVVSCKIKVLNHFVMNTVWSVKGITLIHIKHLFTYLISYTDSGNWFHNQVSGYEVSHSSVSEASGWWRWSRLADICIPPAVITGQWFPQ